MDYKYLSELLFPNVTLTREEIEARPDGVISTMTTYTGTIYTAPEAKAPKGYAPFYMTGYLRHGSRYESRPKYPTEAVEYFRKAAEHNLLTPLGKRVAEWMEHHYERHQKRIGDLTRVGYEQHRGIGGRMCERFPQIFAESVTLPLKMECEATKNNAPFWSVD